MMTIYNETLMAQVVLEKVADILKEMFGATTKQYYIMGDGMFAVLDQTFFNEQEYYDEVAAYIIDSFSWRTI